MDAIYDDSSAPSSPEPSGYAQEQIAPAFVVDKTADRGRTLPSAMAEERAKVVAVFNSCRTHGMCSMGAMNHLRDSLCDVELLVEKNSIRAHRVVLAACSPYFRAMLAGQMTERHQRTIEMHDVEYESVNSIVEYFYTASLSISIESVQQLMVTASMLQVKEVQTACARFMHEHLETANCLAVLQFSILFNCDDLRRAAIRFAELNFREVAEREEFLEQPLNVVVSLISSAKLAVEMEEFVYESVIRWVRHDTESRREHFPVLLKHVRLWQLTLPYLTETVSHCDLVRMSLECRDMIDQAKDYHLLPEMRSRLTLMPARPCTIGVLFVVGGMNNLGLPVERVEKHALENVGGPVPVKASGSSSHSTSGGQDEGSATASSSTSGVDSSPSSSGGFDVPPLYIARSGLSVAIIKDKLYAIGGHVPGKLGPEGNGYLNSVECYDPATRKWEFVAEMKHARRYVAVTALNDKLYAIGGCNAKEVLDVTESYDPVTNKWTECARMRCPRRHAGAAALGENVYVVGGHDGNTYLRSVECYNPSTDQWTAICSMAGRRGGLGVATVENRLYAVGGYNGSKNLSTVEYLEEEHTWKMAVPMKTCRSGLAATSAGGRLLVVGGHCGSSYLETTEWFEPRSGLWQAGPRLALARAVTGVAVFTSRIAAMELQRTPNPEPTSEMESWDDNWEMTFTSNSPSRAMSTLVLPAVVGEGSAPMAAAASASAHEDVRMDDSSV
eukprot:scpid21003/ scgid22509/ Kelch-like protein diablo